jgi:hypothetical protein
MRTEVKAAIIAGIFVLCAGIIYSIVPSLIESYLSQPKIEILDVDCKMIPSEKEGPLKIINISTNEIIARYEAASLPSLNFTVRNKGNEVVAITKITATVLTESWCMASFGPSASFTLEFDDYTLELDDKHNFLDLRTCYSIPIKFRVEPHDVDCFTLTIDSGYTEGYGSYIVIFTLHYDHKMVETDQMAINITKSKSLLVYLFSVNAPGLEENLNQGVISEDLKDIFRDNSFPLSENTTIRKKREDLWEITNYEEKIYAKKEEGRLMSGICFSYCVSGCEEGRIDFYKLDIPISKE